MVSVVFVACIILVGALLPVTAIVVVLSIMVIVAVSNVSVTLYLTYSCNFTIIIFCAESKLFFMLRVKVMLD